LKVVLKHPEKQKYLWFFLQNKNSGNTAGGRIKREHTQDDNKIISGKKPRISREEIEIVDLTAD
jgi:hypothetical protein